MQIGIYWGYVVDDRGHDRADEGRDRPDPVKVIATGGLAALFQQHGHLFDRVEPDLTLRGLALLYARIANGTEVTTRQRTAVPRAWRLGRDWHERQPLRLRRQMADGRSRA